MSSSPSTIRRVLHSWKEIAVYTGRGVRTVQRYELQFEFPVHRPAGAPRSAVLAFSDEIDQWLSDTPRTKVLMGATFDGTPHVHRAHEQAKLGMEQAESIRRRLQDTMSMIAKLTISVEKARERRNLIVARWNGTGLPNAATVQNTPIPPPEQLRQSVEGESLQLHSPDR